MIELYGILLIVGILALILLPFWVDSKLNDAFWNWLDKIIDGGNEEPFRKPGQPTEEEKI